MVSIMQSVVATLQSTVKVLLQKQPGNDKVSNTQDSDIFWTSGLMQRAFQSCQQDLS